MAKSIRLTRAEWGSLKKQIEKDYPPSVLLLRSKMRRVLGFTTRNHGWFNPKYEKYQRDVVLDFFSDKKHTMFLMKYYDYVGKNKDV